MILIIDTPNPITKVISTLKEYTRAAITPVMQSSAGRIWVNVGNVPFGGLCWADVCQKEGLTLVQD